MSSTFAPNNSGQTHAILQMGPTLDSHPKHNRVFLVCRIAKTRKGPKFFHAVSTTSARQPSLKSCVSQKIATAAPWISIIIIMVILWLTAGKT